MGDRPVETAGDSGSSGPFVFTCEHASKRLQLGIEASDADRALLDDHWGSDIGAADVTRTLVEQVGGQAVLAGFSRLIIDANRDLESPTLIVGEVDGAEVSFNRTIDATERRRRINCLFDPFHRAVESALDSRRRLDAPFHLVSIHSFTPVYRGERRDFEIGVLFDDCDQEAAQVASALAEQGFASALNKPYSGKPPDGLIYSAKRHAHYAQIKYLELEIRPGPHRDPGGRAANRPADRRGARGVSPVRSVAVLALLAACGDNLAGDPELPDDAGERPTPIFVNTWGELGNGPGQFFEPSSVELDSTGVVIVAGHEDRVQRFTRDGVLIDIFGIPGFGDGQFNHPHGLAVDRARGDLIYVGDQENDRLQVFDREGNFIRQWGDDKFAHIHDVGIDQATGELFVGDLDLHTLRKFSPTGEVLGEYGGPGVEPGRFNGVWGVSTDSAGRVYVADTYNERIQILDRDGAFVDEWTDYGGVRWRKPTGVFVDTDDVVYVTDSLNQIVALFAPSGSLLDVWDLSEIVGYRTEPEDIVIDAAGEHIYVAEVFRHSVLHLRMP